MVSVTAIILFEAERRSQRRASEAEEQFRLTVEHAPVGICRLNLEGRFEDVNAQFCAITGYSAGELLGRTFRDITHHDDLPRTIEGYARLREGAQRAFRQEKRYLRKDGTTVWAALTAAAVRSADGRPRFLLGVVEDITRRKEAEAQLREAQKLESVSMLAGGIAHDFNNILTGVLGNASLAIETVPPHGVARRLLEAIVQSAERAAQLTRQLLAYAGKGNFVRRPVDLSAAARLALVPVRETAPPGVEFRLELAPALPAVIGDPAQIQQMITALALNAVEAIEERGTVTVRTRTARPEGERQLAVGKIRSGEYVVVEVEDTGAGMDEATRRRMFDPFFTTRFMGRGLGLAAVAGIVRSLEGAVAVRSGPGQGTTVTLFIQH
jgi:PAS domain S-box-containing protein